MGANPSEIDSEENAIFQCCSLQSLIASIDANTNEYAKFTLIGVINNHMKECRKQNCTIHYEIISNKEKCQNQLYEFTYDPLFLKKICKYYFETNIDNFASCHYLRISYAFFLLYALKNFHDALIQLTLGSKGKLGPSEKFAIHKFK